MSRLPLDPRLPSPRDGNSELGLLVRQLATLLRQCFGQVNALAEGRVEAATNAYTAPPTTGVAAQGDFVRNAQPVELGSPGSRYVITGWVCTASGDPGTWRECRALTGG